MRTDPTDLPDPTGPDAEARLLGLLRPDDRGLVPAVVQEAGTGRVLMLAWMDAEALRRTLRTRRGTYWSRSRREYWVKGATSGHVQHVASVELDCDGDALLVRVLQTGPACHTGLASCFDSHLLTGQPPETPAGGQPSGGPSGPQDVADPGQPQR